VWVRSLLPTALGVMLSSCYGQQPYSPPSQTDAVSRMQHHYELAYRLQDQGDLVQADAEHTAFLLAALESVAVGYANIGDYSHAAPVFEEALTLAPHDFVLLSDYARAATDANDPRTAIVLLSPVLAHDAPPLTRIQRARVHKILAEAHWTLNHHQFALGSYLAATYSDPSYDNMVALGTATLSIRGYDAASPIFAAALRTYGDSPRHRMDLGRAFGQYGFPDDAVEEFKHVLLMSPDFPTAHYSLGAAYMGGAHVDTALAEQEFRKELSLNPRDTLCYSQLGQIALARGDDHEAELDLRRATELDPVNATNFLLLGSLYFRINRPQDAEPALRRAIALTTNPEHNFWEIHRAHYLLGRILSANGNRTEAASEFAIAQSQLDRSRNQQEARVAGKEVASDPLEKTRIVAPVEAYTFHAFLQHLTPLIAASYNNLGVHAAIASQYAAAAKQFERAARWNPSLNGVDRNWGRAAFAAQDCAQAIPPLERAMEHNPADNELNSMLSACRSSLSKNN
jgi:tetratricopeptide (TPR) repeat protein